MFPPCCSASQAYYRYKLYSTPINIIVIWISKSFKIRVPCPLNERQVFLQCIMELEDVQSILPLQSSLLIKPASYSMPASTTPWSFGFYNLLWITFPESPCCYMLNTAYNKLPSFIIADIPIAGLRESICHDPDQSHDSGICFQRSWPYFGSRHSTRTSEFRLLSCSTACAGGKCWPGLQLSINGRKSKKVTEGVIWKMQVSLICCDVYKHSILPLN